MTHAPPQSSPIRSPDRTATGGTWPAPSGRCGAHPSSDRWRRREFSTLGVGVNVVGQASEISSVEVRARCIRSGKATELDLEPFSPSPARTAVNAVALFVVVLVVGLYGVALLPNILGYHVVAVSSGSMEPSIQVSDVIVVAEPGSVDIAVGSVIDFRTESGGVVHRVVEVLPDGYRTKGDANVTADSTIVAAEAVSGVGVYIVPLVGQPSRWFATGEWYKAVGVVVVFLAALRFSRAAWLEKRRAARRSGRSAANGAGVSQ